MAQASSPSTAQGTSREHWLEIRAQVLRDPLALERWPQVVDHVVGLASDARKIKDLFKNHDYAEAKLQTLQRCSRVDDVVQLFRDFGLRALADSCTSLSANRCRAANGTGFWFYVGELPPNVNVMMSQGVSSATTGLTVHHGASSGGCGEQNPGGIWYKYGECEKLYSFIDNYYKATGFCYYLDSNEDTYNILVLGPTGAGKSHLINVLFNQKICEEAISHSSVTKEICFIRGCGPIIDSKDGKRKMRDVIVADTVGLCNTEWDDAQVLRLIKGRMTNCKGVDAVFIVVSADRWVVQMESIKKIMEWLQFDKGTNHLNFKFVLTHAEGLDSSTKKRVSSYVAETLGLKVTGGTITFRKDGVLTKVANVESILFTGFPPQEFLTDRGKAEVKSSWELLQMLMWIPITGSGRLQDFGTTSHMPFGRLSACHIQ